MVEVKKQFNISCASYHELKTFLRLLWTLQYGFTLSCLLVNFLVNIDCIGIVYLILIDFFKSRPTSFNCIWKAFKMSEIIFYNIIIFSDWSFRSFI